MNELFDQCVNILYLIGETCNISYKEANIWIFVIIEPILFIAMLYIIIKQRRKIKKLVTLEKK
jgi:hypothetical protein